MGATKPRSSEELELGVGSTTVSGNCPVEPTELAVVRKALLNVGEMMLLGISPVAPTNPLLALLEEAEEESEEAVGETSSVSGRRPVEAT